MLNNCPAAKQDASSKHWSGQCAPSLGRITWQKCWKCSSTVQILLQTGWKHSKAGHPNVLSLMNIVQLTQRCNQNIIFRAFLTRRPQNNGKFCPGSSRFNQLCNTRPCPPHAVDFRAQQCAEYNSKPFRGWYYKWKPYTKVDGKFGPFISVRGGCVLRRKKTSCDGWGITILWTKKHKMSAPFIVNVWCIIYPEDAFFFAKEKQMACTVFMKTLSLLKINNIFRGLYWHLRVFLAQ